jgi:drug/metabolite transporter (DMT)-like permease
MNPKVASVYLLVVVIWSTTPLGIVWSSESVHPSMAVLLRMLIAVILGAIVIGFKKIDIPTHKTALKLYSYSALGIFGGMSSAYMAARYLPSGVMSLIFGLAPLISGLIARKILDEPRFSGLRKIALSVAFVGLAVVCSDNLIIAKGNWLGLVCILASVIFFSLSGVLVKSVKLQINPLATTIGALTMTLPGFIAVWFIADGSLPIQQWQPRAIYSILYLGIFGSLIGFVAYYYILQKLEASTVALVTLMTPVIAMLFGAFLNQEVLTDKILAGALLVMLGLGLFLYGDRMNKHISRLRL